MALQATIERANVALFQLKCKEFASNILSVDYMSQHSSNNISCYNSLAMSNSISTANESVLLDDDYNEVYDIERFVLSFCVFLLKL